MADALAALIARPIAHRGLHGPGVPENSRAALAAAAAAGYAAEIDIQPSADGVPMVFHDRTLDRMTAATGPIAARPAAELAALRLAGTEETIPRLADLAGLGLPLLIEVKDQDGALGPKVGPLETAVLAALVPRRAPTALMSFNPHSAAALTGRHPVGLTSCAFAAAEWPGLAPGDRARLAAIEGDWDFVSHHLADLGNPALARFDTVLAWTVRSPAEAAAARAGGAAQITFEGFLP